METFHIPEGHLPWLAEAVAKLAKAAEKLGTPAPSYEVVERYERRWHDEIYGEQRQAMVKVEVDHVTPVKDGYQFVATIAHHQNEDGTYTNIVRTAPSFRERLFDWNIADFTTASPECGHCQQRRNRNTTYFFHHPDTNEKIQVGATCMKDFTGHNLSLAFLTSLDEFRQNIERGQGGRVEGPLLMEVLTRTAIVISAFGYKSNKAANEYGGLSTSQHVQTLRSEEHTSELQSH